MGDEPNFTIFLPFMGKMSNVKIRPLFLSLVSFKGQNKIKQPEEYQLRDWHDVCKKIYLEEEMTG